MKIKLVVVGKTEEDYLKSGTKQYEERLANYIAFDQIVIPALKNSGKISVEEQKQKEGELIMKHLHSTDRVFLLDESGQQFESMEFARELQNQMNSGIKNLVFLIGGPYGFSKLIYQRANKKISLSKMTFSHQMVRLFFLEQLYRAFTILKNEPYHHK